MSSKDKGRQVKRFVSIFLILGLAVMLAAPSFCQGGSDARREMVVRGGISSLDWVGSRLTVKWFEPESGCFEEMVFTVPSNFKILKSGAIVGLAELHISDQVTVRYYNDYDGTPEVISITSTSP